MKLVQTEKAPSAIGPYSQAVVANGIVYTSGQIALTPEGTDELLSEGVIVQAVRVMKNLEAVLEAAGSSLDDVVKTTIFLADMNDFAVVNEVYEELLGEAVELFEKEKSKLVVYIYKENKLSLSGDLSNELLYKFPEKVLIISRQKSGEMKMSLRSSGNILIPPILKKALEGVEGYGGGHEHACGACVKVRDFEKFLNSIRSQVD